jgi:hypothetical protein
MGPKDASKKKKQKKGLVIAKDAGATVSKKAPGKKIAKKKSASGKVFRYHNF